MNASSDAIETALEAAGKPLLLERPDQVARAARRWRRCTALGFDTEFVRERTYHANLGLVQVSDGETVWLVDPLAEGTLPPVAEVLADARIQKVFHSPSEDLEVLNHVCGVVPDPLVDTQQACALLGQALQLGYHKACEWLLGVAVDKELTRSNWCARPLRENLLRYAALDVCLLPQMHALLQERLEVAGRGAWLDEDCARLVESARQPVRPADSWQRVRGHGRLDGVSLAVLQAVAAWREKEARKRNRPRGFIVPDSVLLAVARDKPRAPRDLEKLEDLHPRARQRYATTIATLVDNVLEGGRRIEPERSLSPAEKKTLNAMRDTTAETAAELGVEPALLATRREMQELLMAGDGEGPPERLTGWRNAVITQRLLELKG